MTEDKTTVPQYAIWYFVAATFVFSSPVLFFRDVEGVWLPVLTLVAGFALIVLGGIRLAHEIRERGRRRPGDQRRRPDLSDVVGGRQNGRTDARSPRWPST